MRSMIGAQITSPLDKILGTITDQFEEDGHTWATIDDIYSVIMDGSEEVLDLCGIARQKNPSLKANFLRLSKFYH